MHGRLNSFQKTMLQWNDLQPYNAVHVARVAGPLDPERLERILQGRLAAGKLRGFTLDRDRGGFRWDDDPAAVEIKHLAGEAGPEPLLGQEVERQLNTPFPSEGRCVPFRFFVLPLASGFFLGLAYFHVVADAEAVVHLMRQLIADYLADAGAKDVHAGGLHPGGANGEPGRSPLLLARRIATLPQRLRDLRRSCRPPCRDAQDLTNRLAMFRLSVDDFQALKSAAKAWEVTVNDLCLALLLKGLAALAPEGRRASRRSALSVGCIVNTRNDLGVDGERSFGLFLGSFVVTHDVPEGIAMRDLARAVRARTRRIKQQRLYLGGRFELAFARLLCSWLSPERRRRFYLKHHPLWGGITNLNLNRLWNVAETTAPADYFRAVSTGPAVPLVLSITTLRDLVNLTFTYRSSVFEPIQVQHLGRHFLDSLGAAEASA